MLLKAEGGVLPLKPKRSIAVVGPHAVLHRDLLSDYVVDQVPLSHSYGAATW